MLLDSHCHLTAPQLAPDFEGVLSRARANGVTGFINIGDDIESSRAAHRQALAAPDHGVGMWCTVGVHPQHAQQYRGAGTDPASAALAEMARLPEVCAIGEIGLDFVYDETHPLYPGAPRSVQEQVLCEQLELAATTGLPVVVHNREADARLLDIMGQWAPRLQSGVFHCFGSPWEVARQVLDHGFYLGFTGLVTFKNAEAVREVARRCPLDRLLLETDSPYLAPVPYRGKTNEPSYLPRVAETVAALHSIPVEELAEITTRNAMVLFRLGEGVERRW